MSCLDRNCWRSLPCSRAPCAMAPSGNRTPECRGAQTHSASAFVTRVWMVYQRALSLSLYLGDAGVSPELEALSRGASCVGKALSLGLSRERGGLARERRERGRGLGQALECTHTSAEAKPRSLARSPVRRGRPVRERWRDTLVAHAHTRGSLALSSRRPCCGEGLVNGHTAMNVTGLVSSPHSSLAGSG